MTIYDYLITGYKGFIGQNLLERINSDKLRLFDSNCEQTISIDPNYTHADQLIHLGYLTNVRDSLIPNSRVFSESIQVMETYLERARKGFYNSLIFTSSASATLATNPYLASKLACEALCTAYKNSFGVTAITLKLSGVYGPCSIHKQSVIASFIKACLDGEDCIIYGNGRQRRALVYVSDVVDAILEPGSGGYITGNWTYSVNEIFDLVSETCHRLLGFWPSKTNHPAPAGEVIDPGNQPNDYKCKVSIEEGIELTFKWFIENYGTQCLERNRSQAG